MRRLFLLLLLLPLLTLADEPQSGSRLSSLLNVEDEWRSWVDYTVAKCYCLVRMDEMFEMVADFPDSFIRSKNPANFWPIQL